MPRELSVFGVLIPTLLPIFCASLLLQGLLDRVLGWAGVYRQLWHPALARFCLLACIFAGLTLTFYQ
ncbi:MAG TPA: DUF1656 domain-containing protein [Pseudoduganella sp.]